MGKGAVLCSQIGGRSVLNMGQFPVTSYQNAANCFPLLWDNPISQHCIVESNQWKVGKSCKCQHKKVKGVTWKALWIGLLHAKNGPVTHEVILERVKIKFCTLLRCKTFFSCVFIWSWIPCHWTNFREFQKVTVHWLTVTMNIMPQTKVKKWRTLASHQGLTDCVCVCVCTHVCTYTQKYNQLLQKTSVSVHKYRKYNGFFFGVCFESQHTNFCTKASSLHCASGYPSDGNLRKLSRFGPCLPRGSWGNISTSPTQVNISNLQTDSVTCV